MELCVLLASLGLNLNTGDDTEDTSCTAEDKSSNNTQDRIASVFIRNRPTGQEIERRAYGVCEMCV